LFGLFGLRGRVRLGRQGAVDRGILYACARRKRAYEKQARERRAQGFFNCIRHFFAPYSVFDRRIVAKTARFRQVNAKIKGWKGRKMQETQAKTALILADLTEFSAVRKKKLREKYKNCGFGACRIVSGVV
jgi:hypothetical protein